MVSSSRFELTVLPNIRFRLKRYDRFVKTERPQNCRLADRLERSLNCCLTTPHLCMRLQIPWCWYLCIKVLQAVRPVATDTLSRHTFENRLHSCTHPLKPSPTPHIRSTRLSTITPEYDITTCHITKASNDVRLHRFFSWISRSKQLYRCRIRP
jgi:hypothetical protein